MSDTAIITLGRFGDVINALPLAERLADDQGSPIDFITHSDFYNLLGCVSYVRAHVAPVERVDECEAARTWALEHWSRILVAQTHGNADQRRLMHNFAAEAYRLAGMPDLYNGGKVNIDKRSRSREEHLWRACAARLDLNRPLIAFNLGGLSSPFSGAAVFEQRLREIARSAGWELLDLSQIRAIRLYDLLGILDRCDALITTDTSTLHLARASDVATIELVNDTPWLASDAGPHSLLRRRYHEALSSLPGISASLENHLSVC